MADVSSRIASRRARTDLLDPVLGVFNRRYEDEAAEAAARLDAAAAAGEDTGPLHGLAVAVKDLIATREAPVTGHSRVNDPAWYAGADAPVVARLRRAGAVVVGSTTLAEHALGRPDPDLGLVVPRNPWDPDRYPGGSSSGSAAGLPHELFDVGLGTDTGGSIRIPAALCGVTGIKPTPGLVPADGCLPLARSLDTVGTLSRSVREGAETLAVLAGREPGGLTWQQPAGPLRIGVPERALAESGQLSEGCSAAFDAALEELRAMGAELVPVELPELYPLFAAQVITLLAEAYEVHQAGLSGRWAEYGRPFRRTVVLGGLISASTYVRAQRVRDWAAANMRRRFAGLAAVATPAWPGVAPRYDDAEGLGAISWLPGLWSGVGFPAIALPMGFDGGLPVSLQLAGLPGSDFELAGLADAYQRGSGWHLRRPEAVPVPGRLPAPGRAWAVPGVAGGVEGAGDSEVGRGLGVRLRELGVEVGAPELDALCGQWALTSMLFGFLPDPLPGG
ncbi:amidase [Streptomyces sp. NPDC032472]|uniref:amidase n=1 Tax=Streptomyces sp. NPDC032472 TaxID=3155018 RepID=UPI0033ED8203